MLERRGAVTERAAHEHAIAGTAAGAKQRRSRGVAEYPDGDRERAARRVAADETHAVRIGEPEKPLREGLEPIRVYDIEAERKRRPARPRTDCREIAEIDR